MRLMIDTAQVSFMVGNEVKPKNDQNGVQRTERNTNVPMWTVQLVAIEEGVGSEVINVTVAAATPPKVTTGAFVIPANLQAIPWAQNGKNGVAYRSTDIKQQHSSSGKSASATAA